MPESALIDGRKIARDIRAKLADKIKNASITPGLAVVLVGQDPASQIYVRLKRKIATELGMNSVVHMLDENSDERDVLNIIQNLNTDSSIHGILVQFPVPQHMNAQTIIQSIDPKKDIDGLHPVNVGALMIEQPGFIPCTPLGAMHLIKSVRADLAGLNAVVIGRSNLVGQPMAQLLLQESATVTVAHSKTKNLKALCQNADLLIAAAGSPHLISHQHVKDGAIIIDVGINRLADGSLCGDVDFDDVTQHRSVTITPVPGGVGPMTIAMLMQNTVMAATL